MNCLDHTCSMRKDLRYLILYYYTMLPVVLNAISIMYTSIHNSEQNYWTTWQPSICITIKIVEHASVGGNSDIKYNIHCLRGVPRVLCTVLSVSPDSRYLRGDSDLCVWCLRGESRRLPRCSCSWSERSLCGLTWPFPSWDSNYNMTDAILLVNKYDTMLHKKETGTRFQTTY